MLLNSLNFIFAFLPVVLILFYVVPGKWKNLVLALASIFSTHGASRFMLY